MRLLSILKIIVILLVILECHTFAKDGDTPKGRSMPYLSLLLEEDPEEVSFTFTTIAGMFNTLPDGASSVRLTFNGRTLASPSNSVTFSVLPGDYTFTAEAMNGTSIIAIMGPIQLKVVKNFPLNIPLAFTAFPAFDTYQTDIGTSTANTLTYFGTTGRDRAIQFGGTANDTLSVNMGAEDDWTEQYSGDGDDSIIAEVGTGDDYSSQNGGAGNDNLFTASGDGNDWIFQVGGYGNDIINVQLDDGNDYLIQEGGAGNDTIATNGGYGNDTVIIDSGAGDDTIVYDVSSGTDTVSIDGGDDSDIVKIFENGESFTVKGSSGNILYQTAAPGDTIITVVNIEALSMFQKVQ